MGIPGDFENPVFKAALSRIFKAVKDAGKFCILFASTPDKAIEGFSNGYDSITYSIDAGVIISCFKEKVEYIKGENVREDDLGA